MHRIGLRTPTLLVSMRSGSRAPPPRCMESSSHGGAIDRSVVALAFRALRQ
jgi:hypothetical protein